MKHGSYLRVSNEGHPEVHRFPRRTLFVSVCLLLGGLHLADLLPTPSLPRFTSPTEAQASVAAGTSPPFPLRSTDPVLESQAPRTGAGPLPDRITVRDVTFGSPRLPMSAVGARISVGAIQGKITLSDARNRATLWSGTGADARFVYSDIAAVRVLRDALGHVLWSEMPTPDLSLNRDADGRTRLTDKKGTLLWEGVLPVSPRAASTPSRSQRRQTTYAVDFAGIKLRGINGYFTLMDDTGTDTRVLWSGTVSPQPTLLLRDGHRFLFWGSEGPIESSDRVTTFAIRGETGQVTISDPSYRILGRQAVSLLAIRGEVHLVGDERVLPLPRQYGVPSASLNKAGCALFLYQNSSGDIVLKNSVVREGERQRVNTNSMQKQL